MDFSLSGWILVYILSVVFLILMILVIVLVAKINGLVKDIKNVVATSQTIANKAEDAVDDIKSMATASGLVKSIFEAYNTYKQEKNKEKK